jgi:hypothetical protein
MRTVSLRESVLQQIKRVLGEMDTLDSAEFPYEDTKEALQVIRTFFEDHQTVVTETTDSAALEAACIAAFTGIRDLLPILGFILRSTNVRNAFEVWGPLRRLSSRIMNNETPLLLSSEWELSPYTFIGCSHLPGFVLIGLPSTESANPFLLPLTGHELGHTVWAEFRLGEFFGPVLRQSILAEITANWQEYKKVFPGESAVDMWDIWAPAGEWAVRQAEESFCDFLGLRVFGQSYLHASAYLLAPHRKGTRSYEYPNKRDRSAAMVAAATAYGIEIPDKYLSLFADLDGPPEGWEKTRFLLSLADSARKTTTTALITKATEITDAAGVGLPSTTAQTECIRAFQLMAPAEKVGCIGSIVNAGWQAMLSEGFFSNPQHEVEKQGHLTQLILKSVEILEIEHRLAGTP